MSVAPLRLLIDANVPCATEAFRGLGTVRLVPGQQITSALAVGADVLIVRSVTRVDTALLQDSPVRFVGSATIGTDHVDLAYLRARDTAFFHAPGSNSQSVVEYVLAALLEVYTGRDELLRGRTVGVVGCGHIGGSLATRLEALGARVLRCDPPLTEAAEEAGRAHPFVPLPTVLGEADIVTLHPPLTRSGPHATHHLIGERELAAMRPSSYLVNASRGAVVDNTALHRALERGHLGGAVLDVWENEPTPDPDLLRLTDIATPHIAGYSFDGKVNGTAMLYAALTRWLGVPETWDARRALADAAGMLPRLDAPDHALDETAWQRALVRQAYDIRADDTRMRAILNLPEPERGAAFHSLRRAYPRRFGWERYRIAADAVPSEYRSAVAEGLGFTLA